jgi:hypothetical protein
MIVKNFFYMSMKPIPAFPLQGKEKQGAQFFKGLIDRRP